MDNGGGLPISLVLLLIAAVFLVFTFAGLITFLVLRAAF